LLHKAFAGSQLQSPVQQQQQQEPEQQPEQQQESAEGLVSDNCAGED